MQAFIYSMLKDQLILVSSHSSRVSHPLLRSSRAVFGKASNGNMCACVSFSAHLPARWFCQMKLCLVNNDDDTEPQASSWIHLETNRGIYYQYANRAPHVTAFLRLVSHACAFSSTNTQIGTSWHSARISGAERVFCGGGVVCRTVSGFYANTAIPTIVNGPFFPIA